VAENQIDIVLQFREIGSSILPAITQNLQGLLAGVQLLQRALQGLGSVSMPASAGAGAAALVAQGRSLLQLQEEINRSKQTGIGIERQQIQLLQQSNNIYRQQPRESADQWTSRLNAAKRQSEAVAELNRGPLTKVESNIQNWTTYRDQGLTGERVKSEINKQLAELEVRKKELARFGRGDTVLPPGIASAERGGDIVTERLTTAWKGPGIDKSVTGAAREQREQLIKDAQNFSQHLLDMYGTDIGLPSEILKEDPKRFRGLDRQISKVRKDIQSLEEVQSISKKEMYNTYQKEIDELKLLEKDLLDRRKKFEEVSTIIRRPSMPGWIQEKGGEALRLQSIILDTERAQEHFADLTPAYGTESQGLQLQLPGAGIKTFGGTQLPGGAYFPGGTRMGPGGNINPAIPIGGQAELFAPEKTYAAAVQAVKELIQLRTAELQTTNSLLATQKLITAEIKASTKNQYDNPITKDPKLYAGQNIYQDMPPEYGSEFIKQVQDPDARRALEAAQQKYLKQQKWTAANNIALQERRDFQKNIDASAAAVQQGPEFAKPFAVEFIGQVKEKVNQLTGEAEKVKEVIAVFQELAETGNQLDFGRYEKLPVPEAKQPSLPGLADAGKRANTEAAALEPTYNNMAAKKYMDDQTRQGKKNAEVAARDAEEDDTRRSTLLSRENDALRDHWALKNTIVRQGVSAHILNLAEEERLTTGRYQRWMQRNAQELQAAKQSPLFQPLVEELLKNSAEFKEKPLPVAASRAQIDTRNRKLASHRLDAEQVAATSVKDATSMAEAKINSQSLMNSLGSVQQAIIDTTTGFGNMGKSATGAFNAGGQGSFMMRYRMVALAQSIFYMRDPLQMLQSLTSVVFYQMLMSSSSVLNNFMKMREAVKAVALLKEGGVVGASASDLINAKAAANAMKEASEGTGLLGKLGAATAFIPTSAVIAVGALALAGLATVITHIGAAYQEAAAAATRFVAITRMKDRANYEGMIQELDKIGTAYAEIAERQKNFYTRTIDNFSNLIRSLMGLETEFQKSAKAAGDYMRALPGVTREVTALKLAQEDLKAAQIGVQKSEFDIEHAVTSEELEVALQQRRKATAGVYGAEWGAGGVQERQFTIEQRTLDSQLRDVLKLLEKAASDMVKVAEVQHKAAVEIAANPGLAQRTGTRLSLQRQFSQEEAVRRQGEVDVPTVTIDELLKEGQKVQQQSMFLIPPEVFEYLGKQLWKLAGTLSEVNESLWSKFKGWVAGTSFGQYTKTRRAESYSLTEPQPPDAEFTRRQAQEIIDAASKEHSLQEFSNRQATLGLEPAVQGPTAEYTLKEIDRIQKQQELANKTASTSVVSDVLRQKTTADRYQLETLTNDARIKEVKEAQVSVQNRQKITAADRRGLELLQQFWNEVEKRYNIAVRENQAAQAEIAIREKITTAEQAIAEQKLQSQSTGIQNYQERFATVFAGGAQSLQQKQDKEVLQAAANLAEAQKAEFGKWGPKTEVAWLDIQAIPKIHESQWTLFYLQAQDRANKLEIDIPLPFKMREEESRLASVQAREEVRQISGGTIQRASQQAATPAMYQNALSAQQAFNKTTFEADIKRLTDTEAKERAQINKTYIGERQWTAEHYQALNILEQKYSNDRLKRRAQYNDAELALTIEGMQREADLAAQQNQLMQTLVGQREQSAAAQMSTTTNTNQWEVYLSQMKQNVNTGAEYQRKTMQTTQAANLAIAKVTGEKLVQDEIWSRKQLNENLLELEKRFQLERIVFEEGYTEKVRQLEERASFERYQRSDVRVLQEGMADALGEAKNVVQQGLSDLMTGEGKGWEAFWNNLWKGYANSASKMLTNYLFQPFERMLTDQTTDIQKSMTKEGSGQISSGAAGGGWLGMLFDGAKKLFFGSDKATSDTKPLPGVTGTSSSAMDTWNQTYGRNAKAQASGLTASFAGDVSALNSTGQIAQATQSAQIASQTALQTFATTAATAITTAMSSMSTITTATMTALSTAAAELSLAATALSTAASNSSTGALANAAGPIANQSSPYIGSGAFTVAAEGGLFTDATPVIIGEAGPEVVLPLSNKKRMVELLRLAGVRELAYGGLTGLENPNNILGVGQAQPATTVTQSGGILFETGTGSNAIRYEDEKEASEEATKAMSAFSKALMVVIPLLMIFGGQLGKSASSGGGSGGIFGWLASLFGGGSSGWNGDTSSAAWQDWSANSMSMASASYAQGGLITKPTMALMGERGAEAVLNFRQLSSLSPEARAEVLASLDSITPTKTPNLPFGDFRGLSESEKLRVLAELAVAGKTYDANKPNVRVWNGTIYIGTPEGGWTPVSYAWQNKGKVYGTGTAGEGPSGSGSGIGTGQGQTPGFGTLDSTMAQGMMAAASLMGPQALAGVLGMRVASGLLTSGYEANPEYGVPTAADVQASYDYEGNVKGAAAQAARDTALGLEAPGGVGPKGAVAGGLTYGGTPTGISALTGEPENQAKDTTPSRTAGGYSPGWGPAQSSGWGTRNDPSRTQKDPETPDPTTMGLGGPPSPAPDPTPTDPESSRNQAGAPSPSSTPDSPTDTDSGRNSAGGGEDCFLRGTRVTMVNGTMKPIEEIIIGDHVLSWDEERHAFTPGTVAVLYSKTGEELETRSVIVITVDGCTPIRCTPRHPFLLADGKWIEAGHLTVGMQLASGNVIVDISLQESIDRVIWNFHVEPCPTYVIEGQIVHNKADDCFLRGTRIAMHDGTEKPVEEIAIGDYVRSWNEVERAFTDGTVVTLYSKTGEELPYRTIVEVSMTNGRTIRCTPRHPFLLASWKWIEAGSLVKGTELASGATVDSISLHNITDDKTIWNFHVEPCPTYIVEEQIVHNKGGPGTDTGGDGGGRCFLRGMLVTMADRTEKPIEKIVIGDRVGSWDEVRNIFIEGTVTRLFHDAGNGLLSRGIVLISFNDRNIRCTSQHLFLLKTGQWIEAGQLHRGDILASGQSILEIQRKDSDDCAIWNFHVEPCPTYIVQGQIVHNKDVARGGVIKASATKHIRMGEGGESELGIFVPKSMEQTGMQGEEGEVIGTMVNVLAKLTNRSPKDFMHAISGRNRKFATGGLVTSSTFAELGEGGKPELVLPLTNQDRMKELAEQAGYHLIPMKGIEHFASGGFVNAPPPPAPQVHKQQIAAPARADVTVISLTRDEDLQAMIASGVARGSQVVIHDVIKSLAGNRAIRRQIQRTA